MRPADLAREHGISTQAVRNYERDGCLPPAERTRSGYRIYTEVHAAALRAYLALIPGYGHAAAGQIMNAVHADGIGDALALIDRGHGQLARDRDTLDAVRSAVGHLVGEPDAAPAAAADRAPRTVGALARRLGVTPATLRNWEDAGIVTPARDPAPDTASSAPVTSGTPSSRTSSGAAAIRWTTSRPWCSRSAPPAAPTPWPVPWTAGGRSSPRGAWPCSTPPRT